MESSYGSGAGFVQTAVGALMLRMEAFRDLSLDPRPFIRGLIFVVVVGVVVALASVVGAVLTEWTSPDLATMFDAIEQGVADMPWREQIPTDALAEVDESMEAIFDAVYRIVDAVSPSIPKALVGIVLQPVGMVVVWIIFGLLAFLFAKLFGGSGTLSQTYGTTSLAAAPYLLGVIHVLPYVQAAGLGTWAVICAYLGVKSAHGLTPGRAFWSVFLSLAVMLVVAIALGFGIAAAVAISSFGLGGAGL